MNYRSCFNAYLKRIGRKASTIKSHNRALSEFCEYIESRAKRPALLRHMVPTRIEEYKLHLLFERGLRPSTVNKRLSALSAFARLLVNKGLLGGNPLDLVSRAGGKSLQEEQIRHSYEQVQKLRSEVHIDVINVRDRAVVEMLYAGLTVRELCSLKYDGSWSADTSMIVVGERQVHLHARACLALEHYMILRPIILGEFLFAGPGPGGSLKPAQVYRIIRRLAQQAGVQIGVRDLRLARYAAHLHGFETALIATPAAA